MAQILQVRPRLGETNILKIETKDHSDPADEIDRLTRPR
jgi:hypothetical protein